MTIRRGESWGQAAPLPADAVVVANDAALVAHIESGDPRPVRIVGGDLYGTLGGAPDGGGGQRFPIDLLRVDADGRHLTAVAHVVVRDGGWAGWRGPIVAVMNTDRLGTWDVAPRAHPNDGQFDAVEVDASMGVRARWQARRRLPSGTHVPHPAIHTSRATERTWTFERPRRLWIDGVEQGPVRSLRVAVEPDGATVHI